jgi:hypothetical protein
MMGKTREFRRWVFLGGKQAGGPRGIMRIAGPETGLVIHPGSSDFIGQIRHFRIHILSGKEIRKGAVRFSRMDASLRRPYPDCFQFYEML